MNDDTHQPNNAQHTRVEQLKRWLFDVRGEPTTLQAASVDASFRRYFRVSLKTKSYIVMDAPPLNNKNEEFIALAKSLNKAGVNTPTVLEVDLQNGFILMEDLGDTQYLDSLTHENADALYSAAVVTLGKIQQASHSQALPTYDSAFLNLEMRLLPEWYFAKHRGLTLSDEQSRILESVFSLCTESALEQPLCFVHRDFHSRNLMLTSTNSPGVLDFQDAVRGPLTYDIASLLRDCYIEWPDDFVTSKLEQHRQLCTRAGLTQANPKQYRRWFDLMALQRHIKVMGLFCRLNLRDGKPHYMCDLPMVFNYIVNTCRKYPELADFHQLLEDTGTAKEFS